MLVLIVPVLSNFSGFTALMASVDTEVYPYVVRNWENNMGVSASWNRGMYFALNNKIEFVVAANDDVILQDGTLTRIINRLDDDVILTTGVNTRDGTSWDGEDEHPDFSLFAVKPKDLLNAVGEFDESFHPAYFEDNDMAYRITLAGKKYVRCLDAPMFHAGSVTQNGVNGPVVPSHIFERNRDYYIRKWGGSPGCETYTSPFNSKELTYKDWIRHG